MGKKLKIASFWLRRRSHLPVIVIGTVVVLLLYFNEDTSVELNMKYDKEIAELQKAIQQNRDSARYYEARRKAVENGRSELEHIAREQYHMQRPSEDVFIINDH